MASKEVKAHLKAAKAAVGKKDFQEVSRLCELVFRLDESNYNAHVFAGLACLEFGDRGNAKQHYKAAIDAQPSEQLAWRGLANFYDKHGPITQDEKKDALQAYQKLLSFVESDLPKKQSTLKKVISLLRELGSCEETLAHYSLLLDTYTSSSSSSSVDGDNLWLAVTRYCLVQSLQELAESGWGMLQRGFLVVSQSTVVNAEVRDTLRSEYIDKAFQKLRQSSTEDVSLCKQLERECVVVVSRDSAHRVPALTLLLHLTLFEKISTLPQFQDCSLSTVQRDSLTRFCEITRSSGEGGLSCVGSALLCMEKGKWREAKEQAAKAVSLLPKSCECCLLAAALHLRFHDNSTAQQHAHQGLGVVKNAPLFLAAKVESKLRLCLAGAYLGMGDGQCTAQALLLLNELAQVMSHDYHVTKLLVKANLMQGNIDQAAKIVKDLASELAPDHHVVLGLWGEVHLTQQDYSSALEKFSSALEQTPLSMEYHFGRGRALWEEADSDKKEAYSCFMQAAKLNPYDSEVFLYIGHYQRLVKKDFKRAAKCYQKSCDLQPSLTEAAMLLADMLFSTGEEEEAFKVYKQVTSIMSATKTKDAWLRMGLYQRKKGLYNEAINSFHNTLTADSTDSHVWECLGEAYLARGSHGSALKAFSRAVELAPRSLYCLYQIASIKQLLSQLIEAVDDYSAILDIEPSYVPALKGRGESYLSLARASLKENFDGRAVNYVSLALSDLTRAVRSKPMFRCLWKLIGDCCTCLHQLAPWVASPSVPVVLAEPPSSSSSSSDPEESVAMEKKQLVHLGCRAYAQALQLAPESDSLWHDLGMAYYYLGQTLEDVDLVKQQEYLSIALSSMKKAVTLKPVDPSHWNALGVIADHRACGNPALAQHAFIMSLQHGANNASAWTNLGTLYLKNGNMMLANKAFQNAQSIEPGYVQAWIGQALIAEGIGHDDTMDLFRQSTELSYHNRNPVIVRSWNDSLSGCCECAREPENLDYLGMKPEASIGYGYWVCHTMASLDRRIILTPDGTSLNAIALRGVLQARDCLQKYLERFVSDACAHNYLGLLYEQEGVLRPAELSLSRAKELLSSAGDENSEARLKIVNANHARILSALGRHSEAAAVLSSLGSGLDLSNMLQLALNFYRECKFKDSLRVYEQLAEVVKDKDKSMVYSAAAMAAFALGDNNSCRTLLFRAFQSPSPSLHGLVALAVLGCVCNDLTLLQAALQEILKILDSQTDQTSCLHPSCVSAVKTMAVSLGQETEFTECVEALEAVLKLLPDYSCPNLPAPSLRMLHSLSSSSETIMCIQKLIHSYPTAVWVQATLTHHLRTTGSQLARKYQQVVLCHVEAEMKSGSSQVEKKALAALKNWVSS